METLNAVITLLETILRKLYINQILSVQNTYNIFVNTYS